MTTTNTERATRVNDTMVFYVQKQLHEIFNPGSLEENLTDMLTDMMHFAASNEIDFVKCLRMAENHNEAEITEEIGYEQQV